ncbi:hypothetical protein ACQ4PT_034195 [Festuca glaucescens]
MPFTDGPIIPKHAGTMPAVLVYAIEVTQISHPLRWPLCVYSVVAVRDFRDHRRNILFRRSQDDSQTLLSPEDSRLELTGPSRALLLRSEDPHADPFENSCIMGIDLKVRGIGTPPSEDKILCQNAIIYNTVSCRKYSHLASVEEVKKEHGTMEVGWAHLPHAVEATITAELVRGARDFSAIFTAFTASMTNGVQLLNSRGENVTVADYGGQVELKRSVLAVEKTDSLVLVVHAIRDMERVNRQIDLTSRSVLRSGGYFDLGFSVLDVVVAWSLLPTT